MRAVAWSLALLLLLAPPGLAEDEDDGDTDDGSSTSSSSTSSGPRPCGGDANETCAPGGNATGNETEEGDARFCAADDDRREAKCERAVDDTERAKGSFDWVDFGIDRANGTLTDYRVAGWLGIESIRLETGSGNLTFERFAGGFLLADNDTELRIHDNKVGLLRFKGSDGNLTVRFYGTDEVRRTEDGARIVYARGANAEKVGHLSAGNATWLDDHTVVLQGFGSFLMPARGEPRQSDEPEEAHEAEERKQDAIERNRIGAEVTLRPRGPQASALAGALNDSVEVLAYDDVEVVVDPAGLSDRDVPIRIEVSSELDEGRTIVLNVDEDLLASTDPADLVLRYFDVYNQTDGSTLETEVLFVAAASLQDVLEPADDGGQPEYWVVEDANGIQVLVSVPHWSTHAITVASIATAFSAPNVAVGIVAGAAASLVMGVLLFLPRRRDDEL